MKAFQSALMLPFFLLFALNAPAQEDGARRGERPSVPLVTLDQLVLVDYTPRHIKSSDAIRVIEELFGSQIRVNDQRSRDSHVDRFIRVGNTILIRDTREQTAKILAEIENLEEILQRQAGVPEPQPGGALRSAEYVPRALSAEALFVALDGHRRNLSSTTVGDKVVAQQENINLFKEGQAILIRDREENVKEILEFLARVDVPARQATFTILVIAGRESGPSSPGLPKELVDNLGQMVPMGGFELLSTAILRGSVRDEMELTTTSRNGVRYTIALEPAAYNESAGTLTLRNCRVVLQTPSYQEVTGASRQITGYEEQSFQTATSLQEREYTALGAVGSDPVFVVLRMTTTK